MNNENENEKIPLSFYFNVVPVRRTRTRTSYMSCTSYVVDLCRMHTSYAVRDVERRTTTVAECCVQQSLGSVVSSSVFVAVVIEVKVALDKMP